MIMSVNDLIKSSLGEKNKQKPNKKLRTQNQNQHKPKVTFLIMWKCTFIFCIIYPISRELNSIKLNSLKLLIAGILSVLGIRFILKWKCHVLRLSKTIYENDSSVTNVLFIVNTYSGSFRMLWWKFLIIQHKVIMKHANKTKNCDTQNVLISLAINST